MSRVERFLAGEDVRDRPPADPQFCHLLASPYVLARAACGNYVDDDRLREHHEIDDPFDDVCPICGRCRCPVCVAAVPEILRRQTERAETRA